MIAGFAVKIRSFYISPSFSEKSPGAVSNLLIRSLKQGYLKKKCLYNSWERRFFIYQ